MLNRHLNVFVSLVGASLSAIALSGCGAEGQHLNETVKLQSSAAPIRISIASYNVENMWDDVETNSTETYAEYSDKSSNWVSHRMYESKARHVAEALRIAGSPDIVGLQEIESAKNTSHSLDILKKQLQKQGYQYFALGRQTATNETSVTTAVVSKFPIVENTHLNFEGDSSARDPQVVTVDVNGQKLRLYNSHWKSKRGSSDKTESQRLQIAKVIKADIDLQRNSNPNLDVLLLGDFNSEYNESQLKKKGPTGAVEGLNATGDERMMLQAAPSERLYNLWFELPENKRCSYSFDGKRDCIDNMLVTDSLFDNSAFQLVDNSLRIVGFGENPEERKLLNADGTPFRWQYRRYMKDKVFYTEHTGQGYSDHLPIVADFLVYPSQPFPQKLVRNSPSKTEFGPDKKFGDVVPVCKASRDPFLELGEDDFSDAKAFSQCFKLSEGNLELYKNSTKNLAVKINGIELSLVLTRSFGENKDNMKKLNSYEGKNLWGIVGRVGWYNGNLAIFANSLSEIKTR